VTLLARAIVAPTFAAWNGCAATLRECAAQVVGILLRQ